MDTLLESKTQAVSRILIVDDEPKNIQLLANILKPLGYQLEYATCGKEALEWCNSQHFDMVLLDILMPEMDGYEVCQLIKKQPATSDIPIIFLSALSETRDKVEGFKVGASDFVTKPFQSSEIIARVQTHLKLKRVQDSLKETMLELNRSNQMLVGIFKSISDTIITVDTDLRVVSVNRDNELCYESKHTGSLELQEVLTERHNPYYHILKNALETKQDINEKQIKICNGHGNDKVLVLNATRLTDQSGTMSGVVLAIRDITRLFSLEDKLTKRSQFRNIIGKSDKMQKVFDLLELVASVDTNILINGESGTGKELIAEALHYGSHRSEEPFIRVNCAALSDSLLESELFGHVKGAFTGAIKDRIGRFQAAHKGTIFLDEIGDISYKTQLRLLRILEQKEFERIGESKPIKVDVRIVSATNADLIDKVKNGEFREDLYYRLKGMIIQLPPLKERSEDIPLLCSHFLMECQESLNKKLDGISEEALKLLLVYHWPGNIRELKHTVEHACILCSGGQILPENLPQELLDQPVPVQIDAAEQVKYATKLNETHLRKLLNKNRWNKVKTAKELGIGRNTLYRYIKRFNIEVE